MTSNSADAITLTLSQRDVQWLAASLAICSTLLSDFEDDFAHNADALLTLFDREYSATEVNAINRRVRELLPLDSPIHIAEGPFLASTSTLLS